MKLGNRVVCSDSAEVVRSRLNAHLNARGFRDITTHPGVLLECSRGSIAATLVAVSPKQWAAKLRVFEPEDDAYRVELHVNTIGQIVSAGEKQFWDAECDAISQVVGSDAAVIPDFDQKSAKSARRAHGLMAGYSIGFAIPAAIASFRLPHLGILHPVSLVGLAAGLGAAVGAIHALVARD